MMVGSRGAALNTDNRRSPTGSGRLLLIATAAIAYEPGPAIRAMATRVVVLTEGAGQ